MAMLVAAQQEQASGRDVVIAFLDPEAPSQVAAQAAGIPFLHPVSAQGDGRLIRQIDLDAVLSRRPQLAVVDELARANAGSARHPARYQDVLELLDAGIHVFTTLNVGNVESCAEAVRQIRGAAPRETVPDQALDRAEFVLIDLPTTELRRRLESDERYAYEAAMAAQEGVFRPGSLSALRELALRFVAEQVGREVLRRRRAGGAEDAWKSGQRLLVAVGSNPGSSALIRWTRRAAGEMHATWVAAHVDLGRPLGEEEQARLAMHLSLARELGAQIVTTTDQEVGRGLLRVAAEHGVTRIIVGKPASRAWFARWRGGGLIRGLIRGSGDIDIHVVRAEGWVPRTRWKWRAFLPPLARDSVLVAVIVGGITCLNGALPGWIGREPAGFLYLLGVVLAALLTRRAAALTAAALSALALNYFFEPPLYSLWIARPGDVVVFFAYFAVAIIVGHLTARLREREVAERRGERHATGLYLLTRTLAQAARVPDLVAIVMEEVRKAVRADVAISLAASNREPALQPSPAGGWALPDAERSVALWAFRQRQPAGRGTGTQPAADGLHLPLLAGDRCLGVMSLRFRDGGQVTTDQRDLLDAFSRQISLALDRQWLRDAQQHAELVAESERLSKTLLNSVSHEMRTPLAAITSAASALVETGDHAPADWRRGMADEIQEAAQRLNRLVGNLLSMTRVQSGHVKPKMDWCDVADVLQVTRDEIQAEMARHPVTTEIQPGLPLVRMDFVLMQQALTNLLLNATVHTPPGTKILVTVRVDAGELVITVSDNGPGLPTEAIAHLFDKFYRGPSAPAGGTGLGLAIVKGFIEAQNGRVSAGNRPEGGAVFTLRMPSPRREAEPAPPPATPTEVTA